MKQIEMNTINSFKQAKSDIIQLQNQLIEQSQRQEGFIEVLEDLRAVKSQIVERLKNVENKLLSKNGHAITISHKAPRFVASKTGKVYHVNNCPFAFNIKPKTKIILKSKTLALNKGYKPCRCIKA